MQAHTENDLGASASFWMGDEYGESSGQIVQFYSDSVYVETDFKDYRDAIRCVEGEATAVFPAIELPPPTNTTGTLYDFTTAQTVCPTGWYLPTPAEWQTIAEYVDAETVMEGVTSDGGYLNYSIADALMAACCGTFRPTRILRSASTPCPVGGCSTRRTAAPSPPPRRACGRPRGRRESQLDVVHADAGDPGRPGFGSLPGGLTFAAGELPSRVVPLVRRVDRL